MDRPNSGWCYGEEEGHSWRYRYNGYAMWHCCRCHHSMNRTDDCVDGLRGMLTKDELVSLLRELPLG